MPRLVVDSSVAVKWFVEEEQDDIADSILEIYNSGTTSLLAPDLINAEIGNIAWKKHIYKGLSSTDAQRIIDEFTAMKLTRIPTIGLLKDAYRLAVTYKCTVYDSIYVALSLRARCDFVTADEELVNAVSTTYPNVVLLANWS